MICTRMAYPNEDSGVRNTLMFILTCSLESSFTIDNVIEHQYSVELRCNLMFKTALSD